MQLTSEAHSDSPSRSRSHRSPRRDAGGSGDGASLDQLLRAGRTIFSRTGIHGVTVDEICREAGTSRATFYFYFRDKKHLFLELLDAHRAEFAALARRQYPRGDAYSRIVATNAAYLYWMERFAPLLAQALSLAAVDKEIRRWYESGRRDVEARISRRIARLVDAREIPETRPVLLAAALAGMMESFAVRYFLAETAVDVRHVRFAEALRVLSETWYRAVYGKTPAIGFVYEDYIPPGPDGPPGGPIETGAAGQP